MIKKAIIPAAGLGTRNYPITKVIPKEMFPINNIPVIHYIVQEAIVAGIKEFIIVISRQKMMIENYFKHIFKASSSSDQPSFEFVFQDKPTGLGGAILCTEELIHNQPFALMLPDDLVLPHNTILKKLIYTHQIHQKPTIAVKQVPQNLLRRYGVINGARNNDIIQIKSIVEKPTFNPPSNLAVIGRYVLPASTFSFLKKFQELGGSGELGITDSLSELSKTRGTLGILCNSHEHFDTSISDEYIKAQNCFKK